MDRTVVEFYGPSFPEDYFQHIIRHDRNLQEILDPQGAESRYDPARQRLIRALRELEHRQQPRATLTHLVRPLADILDWRLGESCLVTTSLGEEDAGIKVYPGSDSTGEDTQSQSPPLILQFLAPDASMDTPPEGHHRRFAPILSMERALQALGVPAGVLINATHLRLVHSEGGQLSWVQWNLAGLAEGTEEGLQGWKLLWAFLRAEALRNGYTIRLIQRARDEAAALGKDLGRQVREALRAFMQAVLDHPENRVRRSELEARLNQLYEESLRFFYRLIFILYAEARDLLPLENPVYREGYSLWRWTRWAQENESRLPPRSRFLEDTLRALFRLLWEGADLGPLGRIPAYRGELFNPDYTPLLNELRIGDRILAYVLIRLTYRETRQGRRRLSYRTLDVAHIGSIYETLMEYVPAIASVPLWHIRFTNGKGEEAFLTREQLKTVLQRRTCRNPTKLQNDPELFQLAQNPPETRHSFKILHLLKPGTVYLQSGFRRKQTGTYFTDPLLVDFLVRKTVDPLAEGKTPEAILQLKIVDPAMGSGHFLVAACRRLARHLLEAYKKRMDQVTRENPDRAETELLQLASIPKPLARAWHDEERALTACKLLVAEHCLYGVDKNPLAVDLAKVTLWIETAARDQPLTFLDHRLRVGDSLLGLDVDRLLQVPELPRRGRRRQQPPASHRWLGQDELPRRIRVALQALDDIHKLVTEEPEDLEGLRNLYQEVLKNLEPFWQLHQVRLGAWFAERDGAEEAITRWLQDLNAHHTVAEETRQLAEPFRKAGEEARAFCWELAFPDVFFSPDGSPKPNPGFDVVLGNPPWDKVKPEEIQFYSAYDPLIGELQGQARKDRIRELQRQDPGLREAWEKYEHSIRAMVSFLAGSGTYRYQVTTLCNDCGAPLPEVPCDACRTPVPMQPKCMFCNTSLFPLNQPLTCSLCGTNLREPGKIKRTGGDPDYFRFFTERAYHLVRKDGFVGFLVPAALYATEGATALRRLLLDRCRLVACCSFENRKRIMPIHRSFKFVTLVFAKGGQTDEFPAAFMLHDPEFLALLPTHPERLRREVRMTRAFIDQTSPGYRLFLEVKNEFEYRLAERLHRQFPRLGERRPDGWNVKFTREFDMTQDAYLFRTAEWLERHGAQRQDPDPRCRQSGILYHTPPTDSYRNRGYMVVHVPQYGIDVAIPPDADFLRSVVSRVDVEDPAPVAARLERLLVEEVNATRRGSRRRGSRRSQSASLLREILTRGIVCDDTYVPLYEGKMVHQFDPAAKAYVRGSGHRQQWRPLGWDEKHLCPHYFVSQKIFGAMLPEQQRFRAGFLDVNSSTNERTMQASIIPARLACGNKVPTVITDNTHPIIPLLWVSFANSLTADWLVRLRIKETLNFFLISQIPIPYLNVNLKIFLKEMLGLTARLSCIIPELADLWDKVARQYPDALAYPWQLPEGPNDPDFDRLPCIDPWERQFLRARLDALAAEAYGLTVEEFAYILSTFLLLDRDQPPLPLRRKDIGNPDAECEYMLDKKGSAKPKSTITRDLALAAYMLHKGWGPSPFGQAHPEFHRWLCAELGVPQPVPTDAALHSTSNPTPSSEPPMLPADLADWYAHHVPDASVPPMGEIRDLEERLYVALHHLHATAYIPKG